MTSIQEFVSELARLDIQVWVEGEKLRLNAPRDVLTPQLQAQLAARKEELVTLLSQSQPGQTPLKHAVPAAEGAIPLSYGQERLWRLAEMRPESSVYNINTSFLLTGPLDVRVMERSLNRLQRRHQILRTVFPADREGLRQHIVESMPVVVWSMDVENDLRSLSPERREQEVTRLLQAELRRPFDLRSGPLWRCLLMRLAKNVHVISFTMHHIIFDGRSKIVFLKELGVVYSALLSGKTPQLKDLPVQYADFARWQRTRLEGDVAERQLAHWQQRLGDTVEAITLPNDNPRSRGNFNGQSRIFELPESVVAELARLGREERTSLFTVLLAAFDVVLHRYSRQEDLIVCAPFAARDRAELEDTIGYFNNIVVLRSDLSGNPTFRELVRRIRRTVMEALENQNFPLQKLADLPNLARVHLTRAMFSYQDTSSRILELPMISSSPIDVRKEEEDFELAMYMEREKTGKLSGILEYNSCLFNSDTITLLLENFKLILEHLVTDPNQKLSEFPGTYRDPAQVGRTLAGHQQIDQAVVVNRADCSGTVAYLVLNEYDVPRLEEIRQFARSLLPDYLLPVAFVPLDTLPLLADGSVDQAALPTPGSLRDRGAESHAAPRTELERILVDIWTRVLWLEQKIGIHDDFTDLGGHSLLSVQLVSEVEEELQRKLPAHALSRLSTVAEMAKYLEQENDETSGMELAQNQCTARSPRLSQEIYQGLLSYTASWTGERISPGSLIVGLNTTGTRQPLYWCLQRYGELKQLSKYLGEEQPIFGMRSGNRVMIRSQQNIEALAAHYVDEILSARSAGPFLIGGNCQAAKIAFEVATRLRKLGHEVTLLVLMEKFVPLPYPGRAALLFSADSDRNPYRYYKNPEIGWKKYYSGEVTFDLIAGKHMQFFREPNIQVLAEALQRRIREAQRDAGSEEPIPATDAFQMLPENAYRARLVADEPSAVKPKETLEVRVEVTNVSPVPWRVGRCSGIALANRWSDSEGEIVVWCDGKEPLTDDLQPGAATPMSLQITAPPERGVHFLELDLIDEGVTWFSDRGSELLRLPIEIG